MTKAKPFDIAKREVWEAFKKVKANQGAAGVDGQSIADFEIELKNNLYKLWNRLSSGSYLPKLCGGWTFRRRGAERGRWVSPRWRIESRKRLSVGIWSLGWTLCSMRTPMVTDQVAQPSMPCAQRVSAAGATTGCSTSISKRSSVRQDKPGASSG
jgi:hypothetical protein